MADPFSLTPDFSWIDQGADEGALVRAAAEVAAARMKQSAKPAAGRQEGAITAGLEHLGTDVYNAAARPSRIINELVGVPPGALSSGLVPRVDQAVPEVAFDLMGLGSMLASPASTAASVGSTAIRRPYVGPPDEALMAVHNTRASRLAKADELGGFAVPSVAVVKPSHGFDSFGDMSLVAGPEFVKPSAKNPVFASDVYSPRFPSLNDEGDKIFRGFTDLGNRRYAPLTLDNLVREMKGNVRGGESFNYGAGNVRAGVTPQFGSLREIQDARGKIVPRDEFEAMKSATNNELIDLAYKFHPYSKYSGNGFQHSADFSSMLGEYRGNMSKVAEHYKNLPPELIDEARTFMGKLRDMPTQYFEAKPQRAVGINEFKGAVVPEAEMSAVAPILERHGIKRIEQYGGGVNDPSRTAALNKFPDLLFSNAADRKTGAAMVAAGEGPQFGSLAPRDIRPAGGNINEIIDSNFTHGALVGDRTMPIDALTGGVRMNAPDEIKRVQKLAGEISGPEGYISRPVVDDAGNVIEGQHRIEALRSLGAKDVPVTVVKDLERGFDTGAARDAVKAVGGLHPDQVHGVMRSALEAAHEAGSPAKALAEYSVPGFQKHFEAALRAMEPKSGKTLGANAADKRVAGVAAAAEAQPLSLAPQPGIRAYHGSPHDFERFDLSKIGTGEGAQAYGHGLYFAEREGTARAYRDSLSDLKPRAIEGNPELTLPSWVAKKVESRNPIAINDVRTDFQGRISEMKRQLADPSTPQPWMIESNIGGLENILKGLEHFEKGAPITPAGRMYEVNINAKPEQFLDWDKPLAGQGEPVRKALNDIWGLPSTEAQATMAGNDAYNAMGITFHQPGRGHLDNQAVSSALREAGVPGIKYLDGGSRSAGTGTNNYVLFDDKLVDILRKYALPGAIAAGGFGSLAPTGDQ